MKRLFLAVISIVSLYHTLYLITRQACAVANRPVIAELHAIRRIVGKPHVPHDVFVGEENTTLYDALDALSTASWYYER